jgi:hypothetical protein
VLFPSSPCSVQAMYKWLLLEQIELRYQVLSLLSLQSQAHALDEACPSFCALLTLSGFWRSNRAPRFSPRSRVFLPCSSRLQSKIDHKLNMSQPSEFVSLVSSDGFVFVINRSAAYVSNTLRRMLDPINGFEEAREKRAKLPEVK